MDAQQLKSLLTSYMNRQSTVEFLYLLLLVYVALDAIMLAWFLLTPLLAQSSSRLLFGLSMLAYNYGYLATNCHQMPQRSLFLNGFQTPMCARDMGVYFGCLLGGLTPLLGLKLHRFFRSVPFLILSFIPLTVDGITQTLLMMRESSNELRLMTGLLFGFGLVYFLAARVVDKSGSMDRRGELKRALRISAVTLLVLLVASYLVGDDYVTFADAVSETGFYPSYATYVPRRAVQTFRYDPYVGSYDDTVLNAVGEHGYRGHGLWILYKGDMGYGGKQVYPVGGGTVRLIPDQ